MAGLVGGRVEGLSGERWDFVSWSRKMSMSVHVHGGVVLVLVLYVLVVYLWVGMCNSICNEP
jgi:hypothetical protein